MHATHHADRKHGDERYHTTPAARDRLDLGSLLMLALPAFLGIYGLMRLFGEAGARFKEVGFFYTAPLDKVKDEVGRFSPQMLDYVAHLHNAYAGFIIATAFATAMLAWYGVRHGRRWAWATALAAPLIALVIMLGRHAGQHFDNEGYLLGILLLAATHIIGAIVAYKGLEKLRDHAVTMTGTDAENRRAA